MPNMKKPMKAGKKVAKRPFQPCSRCPSPRQCMAAGQCIAERFA